MKEQMERMKRYFPWGMFLIVAVLFALAAMMLPAHGMGWFKDPDPYSCYGAARYQAMYDGAPTCLAKQRCAWVRAHFNEWIVNHIGNCRP